MDAQPGAMIAARTACEGAADEAPSEAFYSFLGTTDINQRQVRARNAQAMAISARAGSFGADDDWRPIANFTTPSWFLDSIIPWANTDFNGPVDWPNQWAPLNSNAIYTSNLWGTGTNDQRDQFARRTQQMCGAMFSAGLNVESGPGKTRNDSSVDHFAATGDPDDADTKYSIGSLSQAVILRPGVLGGATISEILDRGDALSAIGVVGVGQVSPYFDDDHEATSSGVAYDRIWTSVVAGAEFIAQAGRRTPREDGFSAGGTGSLDLRELFLKEEDDWEVQTVGIDTMIGAMTSAVIDTKKSEDDVPAQFALAACGPQELGSVKNALGVKSLIAAAVRESWVNTRNTVNFYGVNTYAEIWEKYVDQTNCEDERPGSMIRNVFGVYLDRLNMGARAEEDWMVVGRGIGVFIDEVQPELINGSSGQPRPDAVVCTEIWGGCGDDTDPFKERGASIVARGSAVLGDGISRSDITGWSTDVVHVEGALRLRGMDHNEGVPEFDCCLPLSEIYGTIYYDSTTRRLRVLIPSSGQPGWVAIEVDWTRIPDEFVTQVGGLSGPGGSAFTITYPLDEPGHRGEVGNRGDTVQFLAHALTDGRSAGTTFLLP